MHRKRRVRLNKGLSKSMSNLKKALKKKQCGKAATAVANVSFFAGGSFAETRGMDKGKGSAGYTKKRVSKASGVKRMNSALKSFRKVCHAEPKK
jgi:ribosomal protein L3